MKTVLTIAGSDPSGGAGIQADLKTIEAHGLYGMSAITALTVQNTCGVQAVQAVPPILLGQQIDCVFEDIRPDAVKIGMLPDVESVRIVAERLRAHHAKQIVLDPVLLSSSGHTLLAQSALHTLIDQLLPLVTLVTPNLAESEAFCGFSVRTRDDMQRAAQKIAEETRCSVLIKGGHLTGDADDLLWFAGRTYWFHAPRQNNVNTHGTGCTLSAAIASRLAQEKSVPESVEQAKKYLSACIAARLNLGQGAGPLQHKIYWED